MSFDFSTLVTDRTQADVNRVKQIAEKIKNGTASESELAEFNSAAMKGAYNYTDLNRVTAAMEALKAKLEGYGYAVPGYQRIKVPHVLPEPEPTSKLPEGYTELTYIESTGTQYIDTGIIGKTGIKATGKFMPKTLDSAILLGCYNPQRCYMLSFNGSNVRYGYVDWYTATVAVSANTDYEFEVDFSAGKQHLKLNGTTYVSSANTTAFTNNTTIYAFAYNDNGPAGDFARCRMYSLQLYDNGTLVRDFVPCINPDGAVGLYDLVTAAFFGNGGTGSFACNLDFANQTWQQIIDACKSNAVPSIWKVGDQKIMTINGTDYVIDIIGKNHDTYADGSGVAPLTFQLHDCYGGTTYKMNGAITNSGGWEGSDIRKTILPEVLSLMPAEVQFAIKAVNKLTSAGGTSKVINTTEDKLFLFSEVEVFGTTSWSVSGEGVQYEYYSSGKSKVKNINGSAYYWWGRSPYHSNTNAFFFVTNSGEANATNSGASYGVSFAFCFACDHNKVQDTLLLDVAENNKAEYDQYTWYEFDWPTPETMTVYVLNVTALRSVFAVMASTPSVPPDMVSLMAEEANNIEKILVDINELLVKSTQVWFYSGDLFAGEV